MRSKSMNKYALIFPGQGSQKLGMLADYYAEMSGVQTTFNEASEALGFDLWAVIQNDADKLAQTQFTQPALLAASVAVYRILRERGLPEASLMAGHSLGEYSALVCAGAMDFSDALRLVKARGEFMQAAVPAGTGAMSAIIGLGDNEVRAICEEVSKTGLVDAANFNAPGQVVISGALAAVEKASELAKEQGARMAKLLPVSVPSHCGLMKPAAEKLSKELENIKLKKSKVPVIHNADVEYYENTDDIKDALVRQLYMPVRWAETVNAIAGEGALTLIECGSGKVLSGLNKRINKEIISHNTDSLVDLNKFFETV